jgi:two-component system CheB/CheR fusion protein
MPIDAFLRSLAEDQGENAVGIILSGTGTDGTLGLRAIIGAGGVTLVQDPATARFDGMPASAIRSGYAHPRAAVDQMPDRRCNARAPGNCTRRRAATATAHDARRNQRRS